MVIDRKTVTVEEAARALGISRNGAYNAARRGEIPAIRIGKRFVVPKAALERLLGAPIGGGGDRPGEAA
ncbi:MAG: helix-turn-helix domain-containing protein [Sphingomonadaceae bacterium]